MICERKKTILKSKCDKAILLLLLCLSLSHLPPTYDTLQNNLTNVISQKRTYVLPMLYTHAYINPCQQEQYNYKHILYISQVHTHTTILPHISSPTTYLYVATVLRAVYCILYTHYRCLSYYTFLGNINQQQQIYISVTTGCV